MRDIRLEQQIERAQQNPKEQESKLAVVVGRIVGWLRNGSADWAPNQGEIFDQLDELADSYKIAEAIEKLGRWEVEQDYHDGASEALPLLKEIAEEALDDSWPNLGIYAYTLSAELSRELGADDELESLANALYSEFVSHWSTLSPNTREEILDSTGYLLSGVDSDQQSDIVDNLNKVAEDAHRDHEFSFERRVIDTILSLDWIGDSFEEDLQNRLIQSFESQLDVEDRTGTLEAYLIQEALSRCSEFLEFPQQNEWKAALREAHRDSINDMAEFPHEPSDDELDELNEAVEKILEKAEQVAEEKHPVGAIYYLLAVPNFIPSATRDWDGQAGVSITDLVPRISLTGEGDAIPEPDESRRHSQYGISVQFRDSFLTSTLMRAFERRIITEGSLFLYLWGIEGLAADDVAYLTDMIIAHFEGRYSAAMHLGVARLEGAIASMLQNEGVETASLQEGYMTPTPLPGLLNILEELDMNQDLIEYIRYKYVDISGQQIRNKVAHGRAKYRWAAWNLSQILLFDILLTVGWLEDNLRYYAE